MVEGDRDHLRQALANLVANALKHTPAGNALEISAEASDAWAKINVRDHGDGLDSVALARVFD